MSYQLQLQLAEFATARPRPRCSAFRRHVRRTDDGEIITGVSCQWPVAHQGPHSFEQEDQ